MHYKFSKQWESLKHGNFDKENSTEFMENILWKCEI